MSKQAGLQRGAREEASLVVFHVGGQLLGLSVLPVLRLKLHDLSVSAACEGTAMVTTVPTGFAESHRSLSEKKGPCQTKLSPATLMPLLRVSVQAWELRFAVWRLLLS